MYPKLRFNKSKLKLEQFIELFTKRKRIYVLAFKESRKLDLDNLANFKSNIAKFEVLNLSDDIGVLKAEFKLYQIT